MEGKICSIREIKPNDIGTFRDNDMGYHYDSNILFLNWEKYIIYNIQELENIILFIDFDFIIIDIEINIEIVNLLLKYNYEKSIITIFDRFFPCIRVSYI